MSDPAVSIAGFDRLGPEHPRLPVILAVPHAGREYPIDLRARLAVAHPQLETLEDRWADALVADAVAQGATAFVARRARAWIDLNRDEREIDPAMTDPAPPAAGVISSAKVRGGLGLIPRRLSGGADIYSGKLGLADVQARIAGDHRPYHGAIARTLEVARAAHGVALLLDCHSMPPVAAVESGPPPRLVIGDRYGRSASDRFVEIVCAVVDASGLPWARNRPYAGGHTLDRHGRPGRGIHAIQIEIDRALYLAPDGRTPGAGLPAAVDLVGRIVVALCREASEPLPIAAE